MVVNSEHELDPEGDLLIVSIRELKTVLKQTELITV